ncbi:MAG: aspartate--tRNA(Asn) ligase [Candidatus Pacebacteria bacterium]|nr:aspartate--tRNA(Asn) ligase [Candidatus Paceibacterota bacterium]
MERIERTLIGDLREHIDEEVTISGWVDTARDQGKMAFFDFRDRTSMVQGVVFGKPEVLEVAKTLRPEWVVSVSGKVNKRPEKMINEKVMNGDIELEITGIEVLSAAHELPFDMDAELNLDTYLDNMPLTLRTGRSRAIFKVQAEIVRAYRTALTELGFTEFQAPKLVGDDAEGGGNVFKVDYFYDKDAYLATSPQLYKQIMVGVFERVFATGNVFRAEKHSTTRHLNEYTSLDAEMGFVKDHTDVMTTLSEVVRRVLKHLEETCEAEFKVIGATFPQMPEVIPVMKLREAQEIINKETGEDCTKEPDLEPAHERWLSEYALKEHGSDFIFITHYPVSKRPFYTYEDEEDQGFTKSFDLLFRGVELSTGGQRVDDHDQLVEKIKDKGLNPESFSYYLQAFKYGLPPHGGWGMGLERLTEKMLGLDNVKEATLFPREINRIDTLLSE